MTALDDLSRITEQILEVVGDFNPETRGYRVKTKVLITQKDMGTCINMARGWQGQEGVTVLTPHPQYGPLMNGFQAPVTIDFLIKYGTIIQETETKIVDKYEDPDFALADV
jgi:hypothetical protein